jgi:hypothetical protein
MSRFPFVIHYIDMPDKLWIAAFAHAKRKTRILGQKVGVSAGLKQK